MKRCISTMLHLREYNELFSLERKMNFLPSFLCQTFLLWYLWLYESGLYFMFCVFYFFIYCRPNVESMAMRFGMMKEHRPTTGEVVAFDGSILYLPVKLNDVSVRVIVLKMTDFWPCCSLRFSQHFADRNSVLLWWLLPFLRFFFLNCLQWVWLLNYIRLCLCRNTKCKVC